MDNKINKLCSVIITTYNRENLILETLHSVYNQTYRPIELIIIEDGSTDNTKDVIQKWITEYSEPEFGIIFKSQNNHGAPAARNRALSLLSGKYVQEVGSDDMLHPYKLELEIAALEKNETAQTAWNPLQRFNHGDKVDFSLQNISNYKKVKNSENVLDNRFQFLPSAALHRAEVFHNAGDWDVGIKRWQDLIYHAKMSSVIDEILVFDTPMYFFRQHSFGRINDQYKNVDGIKNGMVALQRLEGFLSNEQKRNNDTKRELFYLYLSILQSSLKHDVQYSISLLLKKIYLWSPGIKWKSKTILLIIMIRFGFHKCVQNYLK